MTDEFIDNEIYTGEKGLTYDIILLRQIETCVRNLSKERIGGYTETRIVNGKPTRVYIEDVREVIIESVNTLHYLLKPVLKNNKLLKEIEELEKEYDKKIKELEERTIEFKGITKKIKDIKFIPVDSQVYQEKKEIECVYYENLFGLLLKAYHKGKMDIKEMEVDG